MPRAEHAAFQTLYPFIRRDLRYLQAGLLTCVHRLPFPSRLKSQWFYKGAPTNSGGTVPDFNRLPY